jgi:uncharacterized protein
MDRSGREYGKGVVVICSYRPKAGKTEDLLAILRDHVPELRGLGLATGYPRQLLTAADGTVLEVFEWESEAAARRAHDLPEVRRIWDAIADVAEPVPLRELPETARPFAHFEQAPNERTCRVMHFEIQADDPERCGRFYASVFGWAVTRWSGGDYWLVDTGREPCPGIDGGLMKRRDPAGHVCNTVVVESVDRHAALVVEHGGRIVVPKMPVPGVGWLAYGTDTEGNVFGMMEPDMAAG